jgi:glutamate-ammonia-ligase adenylyltransferase
VSGDLPHLPEAARLSPELASLGERRWHAWIEACRARGVAPPDLPADLQAHWQSVLAFSDFAARACSQWPQLVEDLARSGDLRRATEPGAYRSRVQAALAGAGDEPGLKQALRRLRAREMVRIAWRDLVGAADLAETLTELSGFADAVLDATLGWLHEAQARALGVPEDPAGDPQRLVILALGKLGGGELNFSSDVDLVFALPQEGRTVGGRRELTSSEFFIRLGQRLIGVLSDRTPEGFVFRVDMRLRPFGASGPLVVTFDGMEHYYQSHGRDWERYALIKARPVAGDLEAGARLLDGLRPFVFRRYLDYGAYEALREMKALVAQEVARKGMHSDLKLGPGGIREIEFIAQALQLVRGGREPALRQRPLLPVLAALGAGGHLPSAATEELAEAYRFLRRAEHRVQEQDDRQTQALPKDALGQERLACAMGFADWSTFTAALHGHRRRVEGHFQRVFPASRPAAEPAGGEPWRAVWLGLATEAALLAQLTARGFEPAEEAGRQLEHLRGCRAVRLMSRQGRQRLDRLMPLLLEALADEQDPSETLRRVLPLLEATARRSVYLALLAEHPDALAQLVRLCAASPWIAEHLARYPILLDELLDPRTLYAPPDRAGLAQELERALERVPAGDAEQEMEALRLFKQTNVLRVAAADLSRSMRLMVVSDHLTWIAEVILGRVLTLAWRDLTARHGTPRCRMDGQWLQPSFGIVAYGKLGGIELGYGSDLDLVFLHTSAGEDQATDGPRPVPNGVFFNRLASRIIHLLTAHTATGVLYPVDARLRPSGGAGLMVSSMEAFEHYQQTQAWTWEHQALVRARPVVASPELAVRFEAARLGALTRERDPQQLRREVREMRARMREHLGIRRPGRFDLKHDLGGIADIEFMVQYLALRWGREHPQVLRYTDNVRLIDGLAAAGRLDPEEARLLADAYRAYRAQVHALALQGREAVVDGDAVAELPRRVTALWGRLLEA